VPGSGPEIDMPEAVYPSVIDDAGEAYERLFFSGTVFINEQILRLLTNVRDWYTSFLFTDRGSRAP